MQRDALPIHELRDHVPSRMSIGLLLTGQHPLHLLQQPEGAKLK